MPSETKVDTDTALLCLETDAGSDGTLGQYSAISKVMGTRMEQLGDIDRLISREGGTDIQS